jgi:hypothetical protein
VFVSGGKGSAVYRSGGTHPHIKRSLKNTAFCPISVSGKNFNPQNTKCIPLVKIYVFLELEPQLNIKTDLTGQAKISILKDLYLNNYNYLELQIEETCNEYRFNTTFSKDIPAGEGGRSSPQ